MSHKKPQPGKIGANLWAIFDRTEDNSLSQRRNEAGEVMTFPPDNTFAPISKNRWLRNGYSNLVNLGVSLDARV